MRVVEILNAYPGEAFIRQHANALVGHTDINLVWAYCQTDRTGTVPKAVAGLNDSIALFNSNRASALQKFLVRLRYLNCVNSYEKMMEQQLRALNPDVIHFHFASLAVRHLWLTERLHIPFTFSVRGTDVQTDPVVYGDKYISQLAQVADKAVAIHAVTEDLKFTLNRYCGNQKKTVVIRTCIHESWTSVKRTPVRNLFLAVGRLHWRKGFPDLLLACRTLVESCRDFKLVIIGEGPQREMLEYMIRDLNLSAHVELAGNKNHGEIQRYFSTAYAFVLSSVEEGFPNVLGEAMLARVPIVSTNLPGVTEVVEAGSSGELAEVGNPESLATAMLRTIQSDPGVLTIRSEHAFAQAVELFSVRHHAITFSEFWLTAIKQ